MLRLLGRRQVGQTLRTILAPIRLQLALGNLLNLQLPAPRNVSTRLPVGDCGLSQSQQGGELGLRGIAEMGHEGFIVHSATIEICELSRK